MDKPDQRGKLIWLSGPPGAGKSTTCQLMARDKDFIYYEADCIMQLINPFTDPNVDNPSVASFSSKPLKVAYTLWNSIFLYDNSLKTFREFQKKPVKYCWVPW